MAHRLGIGCGLALMALASGSARADPAAPDARSEALIEQAREQWRVPPELDRCAEAAEAGEIVVCAVRDNSRYRAAPSSSADPASREALRDGMPRAPQLDRGSCKGQAVCIVGGWAPPPLYIIDLAAIPEAPPGSDADKVARGEMSDR